MKKLCHQKLREIKSELKKLEKRRLEEMEQENLFGRSIRNRRSFQVLLPGSNWCGDRNRAESYTDLNLFWKTDKCCRTHDFCKKDIPGFSFRYSYYNFRPFTISHCKCDDRTRRDISDFLRVPGTQWCGKGYSAKKYTDVGMFSQTDRCCRKHDLACPYWIGGFQMKYGVRNNMINTLMHCSCDERFRACLKRVGTIDANLVGNIFFNFVQRECFTLEPKNKCDKKKFNNLKLKKNDSMKSIKVKNSNVRRRKRNERKCRRKNSERKATIRRNLVY
nr:phospholipase A2 imperatoxin-1-like [Onthophagus taurus]